MIRLPRVFTNANIAKAWKRVKSNRGAPGIDGMRVEDFADQTRAAWPAIRQSLLAGRYQPEAAAASVNWAFRPYSTG